MVFVAFSYQQQRYVQFLAAGKQAVLERRFNSQDYVQASRIWFANQEALLFDQGVLAHTAGNLQRASGYFRRVSHQANHPVLQTQAFYNLGLVLLELQEAQGAVELFKEALRLDPHDIEAKFMLEHLYHMFQPQNGTREAAAGAVERDLHQNGEDGLKQAPGLGQNQGQGRSGPRAGI
jgi:tetratricopeptide (TPR) repeat protein